MQEEGEEIGMPRIVRYLVLFAIVLAVGIVLHGCRNSLSRYLKQLQIREQKLKSNFDRGNLWYWGFFFWVEAGLFVCAWVLFLVLRLLGWMLWVFFALVGAFLEALAEHNNGR